MERELETSGKMTWAFIWRFILYYIIYSIGSYNLFYVRKS